MAIANAYSFEITTTQLCNMKCTYCFEDSAEGDIKVRGKKASISTDVIIKKTYDLLASETIKKDYDGNVHIIFWGGEPTGNMKLILAVLSEFCNNEKITFMLYTNGYLAQRYDKIALILDTCKFGYERFHIQVSYDGHKISSEFRLTHGGGGTAMLVRDTIDKLYLMGFDINVKGTLPIDGIKYLEDTWDEHHEMILHYKTIPRNPRATFRYMPTIDYSHGETDKVDVAEWERIIRRIAKKEIAFYLKHGYHLWAWFEDTTPVRCGFTSHGSTMNVNGDMYRCHGEFYHNEKDVNVIVNIEDDNFADAILAKARTMQALNTKDYDNVTVCDTCVATHCQQCNSVKRTFSKAETFEEQWKDFSNQPSTCTMYKIFGATSRAVRDVLESKGAY
jgi:sulfatase maturation enzyme AslB (radical SAM superfamily)